MKAFFFDAEPFHAGFVAEDAAAGDGTGGVDAEDGHFFAAFAGEVDAEGRR